jgi:hypothetical protein
MSIKENLGQRGGYTKRAPDPTPITIRIECRKLQRQWTAEEKHLRKRYYQA